MNAILAMPSHRRGQKLAYSFDEDEWTLAWDAVRAAGLAPGTRIAPHGFERPLPAWFWKGTGLIPDETAPLFLRAVPTTVGSGIVLHDAAAPDIDEEARRLHAAAPARSEADWQRHRLARDAPDTEADFPMGAFVAPVRHDEALAERMRHPGGRVVTWTRIEPGAAPTEFMRLQEAVGAYHVVMAELPEGRRTVGLWAGEAAPTTGVAVKPVLRRLFRQQGAWRYGVKFAPSPFS